MDSFSTTLLFFMRVQGIKWQHKIILAPVAQSIALPPGSADRPIDNSSQAAIVMALRGVLDMHSAFFSPELLSLSLPLSLSLFTFNTCKVLKPHGKTNKGQLRLLCICRGRPTEH
jgi:hypothetical protein